MGNLFTEKQHMTVVKTDASLPIGQRPQINIAKVVSVVIIVCSPHDRNHIDVRGMRNV